MPPRRSSRPPKPKKRTASEADLSGPSSEMRCDEGAQNLSLNDQIKKCIREEVPDIIRSVIAELRTEKQTPTPTCSTNTGSERPDNTGTSEATLAQPAQTPNHMAVAAIIEESPASTTEIMTYTYPKFYDKHLPSSFAGSNPTLASLFQYRQPHVISAPYKLETTIYSKGDTIFHNFAKAAGFHADLYDAWVNERINHNLLVETWQNGPKIYTIRSNCTETYKVYNVQEVTFPVGSFHETKDHSKWAVSRTGKWTCIGDINRQYPQFKRGGSTMCFVNTKVWSEFIQRIRDYETCGLA